MFKRLLKILKDVFKSFSVGLDMAGKKAVTKDYPKKNDTLDESSKQRHALMCNEDSSLRCIACKICAKACPVNAIKVETEQDKNGNVILKDYIVDYSKCIFCGLCEQSCPVNSIVLLPCTENLAESYKVKLIYDKNKLVENGKILK